MKTHLRWLTIGLLPISGLLLAGLVIALFRAQPAGAAGAVYYVAPGGNCGGAPNCYASIQAAVDAASSGDEIRIAGGTYTGVTGKPKVDLTETGLVTQVVYINKSLDLVGGFTAVNWTTPDPDLHPTTIDAQSLGRGVYIAGEGITVRLENLAIVKGNATGQRGHFLYEGYDAGGGVYVYKAGLDLVNCDLSNNKGGTGTTLAAGGGLFGYMNTGVAITGTQITQNTAGGGTRQGNGGGLGFYNSTVSIYSSAILSNTGGQIRSGFGGGLYVNLGSLKIEDSELRGNLASNPISTQYVGHGGALYMTGGTASLVNVQVLNNTGSNSYPTTIAARGGGLHFANVNVSIAASTIQGNLGTTKGKAEGGGLLVDEGQLILTASRVVSNTGSLGNYGNGGGIYIYNADSVVLQNNTISWNVCTTKDTCQGGGVYINGSHSTLIANVITDNIAGYKTWGMGGGIYLHGITAVLDRNLILRNTVVTTPASNGDGGGVYVSSTTFTLTNNIIADNNATRSGSGVYVLYGKTGSSLVHNTIANNTGVGQGVYNAGATNPQWLTLKNNIITGQAQGVFVDTGALASLDGTLWYGNNANTAGAGTIQTNNDITGDPAFVDAPAGDYHITTGSAALSQAVASTVDHDIDDQGRPNGTGSDLGADEYYLSGPSASAEKSAFLPQWWVRYQPLTGELSFEYIQRYLITFSYADPTNAALSFRVTDTLPAGLAYEWAAVTPPMSESRNGAATTWQTLEPLPSGDTAAIVLGTSGQSIVPGETLTNLAQVKGGQWVFNLAEAVEAPLFPPVITEPGSGEKCAEPGGLVVKGVAVPDELVKIYRDGVQEALAQVDSQGFFTASIGPYAGLRAKTQLTAVACLQSSPTTCSSPSPAVELIPAQGMFCPQASTWVDVPEIGPFAGQTVTYRFRDATGKFVTEGWEITAPLTFKDTVLNLKVQSCPAWTGFPGAPTGVWISIEDIQNFYPDESRYPWYTFTVNTDLPQGYYDVHFYESCGPAPRGVQAGIVLSSTAALDLGQAGEVYNALTDAPLAGVTVTLMASNTAWGGWTPWLPPTNAPGQNPQVSGADGSFSFLAPPGEYYLLVEPLPGYQPYRTPVITQAVALAVPLTPSPAGPPDVVIHVGPAGPLPAQAAAYPGQVVRWVADIAPDTDALDHQRLYDQPAIRLQGASWDSGMLVPGAVFDLQFNVGGDYPYTDGQGHSGVLVVRTNIYLPIILR